MPKYDDDLFKESTMTFGEHLEELRTCLVRALLGLAIGFVIGLYTADRVVAIIEYPIKQALKRYYAPDGAAEEFLDQKIFVKAADLAAVLKGETPAEVPKGTKVTAEELIRLNIYELVSESKYLKMTTMGAPEAFAIYVKAALLAGAILASPWIFYQIWAFVGAGLYPHEKRYVYTFLPISLGLFLAGVAVAFTFVFGPVLDYLFSFNKILDLNPEVRISEWLSFALLLPVGFGIAFQLPLIMFFLDRINVIPAKKYLENWRMAILGIFIGSAILTPADPYSMLFMAVPLCFLYYLGAGLCIWLPRADNPFDDGAKKKPKPEAVNT